MGYKHTCFRVKLHKFLFFYVKKLGQPAVFKCSLFFIVIALIIVLFPLGTRRQFKLLERSANTELWYTANANISEYLPFSDPHNCKYCRNSSKICSETDGHRVVYFVTSYVRNAENRHAIRATWGSPENRVRPIFVMGFLQDELEMASVLNESKEYGDIIIENFVDTFENATLKTAGVLKHFNHFCSKTRYLMKTEDDVFVNTDVVENIAQIYISSTRVGGDLPVIGYIFHNARVVRSPRSLWYVGHTMYTPRRYPEYASRRGYLIPGNNVKKILKKSIEIPIIPIEDAFFTGIVASHLGLNHKMDMKFNWQPLKVYNHCIIRTRSIVYESDPFKMYNLWTALRNNPPETCFIWYNRLMVHMFS